MARTSTVLDRFFGGLRAGSRFGECMSDGTRLYWRMWKIAEWKEDGLAIAKQEDVPVSAWPTLAQVQARLN